MNLDGVLCDMTEIKSCGLLGSSAAVGVSAIEAEEVGRGDELERYEDAPEVDASSGVGLYGADMVTSAQVRVFPLPRYSPKRNGGKGRAILQWRSPRRKVTANRVRMKSGVKQVGQAQEQRLVSVRPRFGHLRISCGNKRWAKLARVPDKHWSKSSQAWMSWKSECVVGAGQCLSRYEPLQLQDMIAC